MIVAAEHIDFTFCYKLGLQPCYCTAARTAEIYEQPGRERSNNLKEKTEREIEPVLNAPLEEVKGILNLSFRSCRYFE